MTPEELAILILTDGQHPELKAKADRECDEELKEALKNPDFKARWDAHIKAFADRIDEELIKMFYLRK